MAHADRPFHEPKVEAAFAAFPAQSRAGLMELRHTILDCAARLPGVGRIHETLKWGQPAYLTPDTGSGSTLRLGVPKSGGFALYVHCQTSLLPDFRDLFPDTFRYEGNRAVLFTPGQQVEQGPIGILIGNALTYHIKAKGRAR